jgi:hypothetical protein
MFLRLLALFTVALSLGAVRGAEPPKPVVREAFSLASGIKSGQALPLSPGKFRALVLDKYEGLITWDVTPADTRDKLVAFEELPKGTKVHGWLEGDAGPKLHTFPDTGSDLLYIRALDGAKGKVTVAAWGVKDNRAVKLAEQIIEVSGARPPPGPEPEPEPTPEPEPQPVPADAALIQKFKDALTKDVSNGSAKQHAADLAAVYASSAILLTNEKEGTTATVGDLYSKTFISSVNKGIPRRPYLNSVRDVVDSVVGKYDPDTQLDPTLKAEFVAKYNKVAAALAEVAK